MTIQIGTSGTAATAAQIANLHHSTAVGNRSILSTNAASKPAFPFKTLGAPASIALNAAGSPTDSTGFPAVPANAVAVVLWPGSNTAGDAIFFACRSGILANLGGGTPLATNTAANLSGTGGVPSRRAMVGGAPLVIPLPSKGAAFPAGWRYALGQTAGVTVNVAFLDEANAQPYIFTATEEFLLTGAGGAALTLPVATAAKFPVGYKAVSFEVVGPGVKATFDSTAPTAALGWPLIPGTYDIDETQHGVSLAAIKVFAPTGSFVVGQAWNPAP